MNLWCVRLTPIPHNDKAEIVENTEIIMAGPGSGRLTDFQSLRWAVLISKGVMDLRAPSFAERKNTLVVFSTKRAARQYARQKSNDYWKGSVCKVRIE